MTHIVFKIRIDLFSGYHGHRPVFEPRRLQPGRTAAIDTVIPITFLHFRMKPGARFEQPVSAGHTLLAYVFSGEALLGPDRTLVGEEVAALFGEGDRVLLAVDDAAAAGAELLLLSGPPLGEPMARHGPFVMNTREQIEQALQDYRDGVLGIYDRPAG